MMGVSEGLEQGRKAVGGVAQRAAKAGAAVLTLRGVRRIRERGGDDDTTKRARNIGLGALGGAAGLYFFDPANGRRRRAMARQRGAAIVRRVFRRGADRAEVATKMAQGHAAGAAHEARKAMADDRPAANDQELADRVRTELFRPEDVPKGSISINAEMGVVYLRGQVDQPEQIKELVSRAQSVEGVRAVENMLHAPGQPAPMKQETEPETRRRVFGSRRG